MSNLGVDRRPCGESIPHSPCSYMGILPVRKFVRLEALGNAVSHVQGAENSIDFQRSYPSVSRRLYGVLGEFVAWTLVRA